MTKRLLPHAACSTGTGRTKKNRRGAALLLVLWIMTLLAIMVMAFSRAARTEARAVRNHGDALQARFIARAGMEAALFRLLSGEPLPVEGAPEWLAARGSAGRGGPWIQSVFLPPVSFGGGEFRLRIQRESGRINLNRAGGGLLIPVFLGLGADRETAEIIAASIQDWRDPDGSALLKGAESRYYRSLRPPRTAKNSDFDSVRELRLVRGIADGRLPVSVFGDGVTWTLLEELFTVFPKADEKELPAVGTARQFVFDYDRITLAAAPASLLAVLAGGDAAMEARLRRLRVRGELRTVEDLKRRMPDAGRILAPLLTDKTGPVLRIQSLGYMDGAKSGQEVVLHMDTDKRQPPDILIWNEAATLTGPGPGEAGVL
ncbi:MAG: hypothetical protein CSB33_03530 [Desulfobacterales bacterium]|nr:MAG: hypothetical protein CSB33_03530 [Desulfobacterales bacterium]